MFNVITILHCILKTAYRFNKKLIKIKIESFYSFCVIIFCFNLQILVISHVSFKLWDFKFNFEYIFRYLMINHRFWVSFFLTDYKNAASGICDVTIFVALVAWLKCFNCILVHRLWVLHALKCQSLPLGHFHSFFFFKVTVYSKDFEGFLPSQWDQMDVASPF